MSGRQGTSVRMRVATAVAKGGIALAMGVAWQGRIRGHRRQQLKLKLKSPSSSCVNRAPAPLSRCWDSSAAPVAPAEAARPRRQQSAESGRPRRQQPAGPPRYRGLGHR